MKIIGYFIVMVSLFVSVASHAVNGVVDEVYQKAAKCYHDVKNLPRASQSRAKWHNCVTQFDEFVKSHKSSERVPDAIYSSGLSYMHLYGVTENEEDAKAAIKKFNDLVRMFGKSPLADDALYNAGMLEHKALARDKAAKALLLKVIRWYPTGDMAQPANDYLKSIDFDLAVDGSNLRKVHPSSKYAKLQKIERIDEVNGHGKIILGLTEMVQYRESYSQTDNPNLLLYTLELNDTFLSRMLESGYSYVGRGIIRDVEPIQVSKRKAQVNITISKGNHCEAVSKGTSLEIYCRPGEQRAVTAASGAAKKAPKDEDVPEIVEKAAPDERVSGLTVVIDAGHGGKDTGAIGPGQTKEKDIVLQISKRLGWYLRNKLGMDVNYTRIDDKFVSLDDRNAISNGYNADLFVSIHANASESDQLTGYQTFFLNNATDEASRRLAARENESLGKSMDDLEKIILTMMQNMNTEESRLLAQSIHKKVLSGMSRYGLKDRKVKSALFYVLVGSKSPSVLVETSFISNPEEEKKLANPDYQEALAKAIGDGIKEYLEKSKLLKTNI